MIAREQARLFSDFVSFQGFARRKIPIPPFRAAWVDDPAEPLRAARGPNSADPRAEATLCPLQHARAHRERMRVSRASSVRDRHRPVPRLRPGNNKAWNG